MRLQLTNDEVETAIKRLIIDKIGTAFSGPVYVELIDDTKSKLDELVKSFAVEFGSKE